MTTKSPIVWSPYQKKLFIDIAKGEGHTVVIARAGSAKTSSIVEGAKYLPRGKKSLFCAFNKSIQEELKGKLPSYVDCLTLHSLGFRAVKQRFGQVELDNKKCWGIVETFFSDARENYDLIDNICKTVDLCKATLTDVPSKIEELIIQYDIETCETDIKEFIQYVCRALRECKAMTNKIDFNDMIWFCFVYKLNPGKFDYVFIDEAQDLNVSQIELALSAVKINGRVIAVLDNYQALYSWRGADSGMLDRLRERLSPKELALPICYRCPSKVVKLAQQFVPDIQVFDKAIEGDINYVDVSELQKLAKPGSYVLSRVNAPLIKHCLKFLKAGIPANILGRDVGDGLLYLIKKSKKKQVGAFLKWMGDWARTEKARIIAKYPKASTEMVDDKVECMENLCDGAKTLEEVKANINALFKENDEKKIVLFSSVHKIKGKETDHVFVLTNTLRSSTQEELNIKYVAFTRAKKALNMVGDRSKSNGGGGGGSASIYDDGLDDPIRTYSLDNVIGKMRFDSMLDDIAEKHHGMDAPLAMYQYETKDFNVLNYVDDYDGAYGVDGDPPDNETLEDRFRKGSPTHVALNDNNEWDDGEDGDDSQDFGWD